MFTLHSTAGLFLGVLPLLLGLATAVVPLQVGGGDRRLPRASAAAYWTWLVSGGWCWPPTPSTAARSAPTSDGVALYIAA